MGVYNDAFGAGGSLPEFFNMKSLMCKQTFSIASPRYKNKGWYSNSVSLSTIKMSQFQHTQGRRWRLLVCMLGIANLIRVYHVSNQANCCFSCIEVISRALRTNLSKNFHPKTFKLKIVQVLDIWQNCRVAS